MPSVLSAGRGAATVLDRPGMDWGLVLIRDDRLTESGEALKQTVKLQRSPVRYYAVGPDLYHLGRTQDAWRVHKQLANSSRSFGDVEARSRTRFHRRYIGQYEVSSTQEERQYTDLIRRRRTTKEKTAAD